MQQDEVGIRWILISHCDSFDSTNDLKLNWLEFRILDYSRVIGQFKMGHIIYSWYHDWEPNIYDSCFLSRPERVIERSSDDYGGAS